jgi:hypothetical protein
LSNHLQLAPWLAHYWATPPPKYDGNTDPHKFLICYKAAIASAGGDKATLAKSLIISLEDAAANWYSRLPPKCIYSWQQLKEKFFAKFPGVLSGARHGRRIFVLCSMRKRNTSQFLSKVHAAQGSSPRSI